MENNVKFLQKQLEKISPLFEKGGKLEKLFYLYEATESFLLTTNKRTTHAPHIRDGIDIKRFMSIVVIALVPAIIVGAYNVGYQSFYAKGIDADIWQCLWSGFLTIIPIIIVSYAVGGFWEVLFALVRKHEINEGFFVTGILFALILPPTIPLWQVAMGITFGVIIGKEVFGGTGMNILNPALTARAFLFFAYPGKISGDKVWTAIDMAKDQLIDGFSGATPLLVASKTAGQSAAAAIESAGFTFKNLFLGLTPGCIGETSTIAILLGAIFLLVTGVASWRIMSAVIIGGAGTAFIINLAAGTGSPGMLSLPPHWHLVMGGFAFGTVFMATDPVSAASTNTGKWIYGIAIGVLAILIRTINPAYPEGMMLAILFMNVFAPLIDYFLIKANIRRRLSRA
jgi:Na+-transporting NADH:ubiquinone oxidoreductase subunit B